MVRLLEAMKLYLSTRYCVFVMGLDFVAVEHAVDRHWEGRPRGLGREYLDKLVQARIHMPRSRLFPVFIHNRMCRLGLLEGVDEIETKTFVEEPGECEIAPEASLLAQILEGNPRRVKNFLSSLSVAWKTARSVRNLESRDLSAFSLLTRLRVVAPKSFELLRGSPEVYADDFFEFLGSIQGHATPIEKAGVPVTRLWLSEWGHLARPDREAHDIFPLELDEFAFRAERVRADRVLIDELLKGNLSGRREESNASLVRRLVGGLDTGRGGDVE